MGWVVNATARPFYPRERTCAYYVGVWVGSGAGLDRCEKFPPPLEFDPQTVQPLTSRYTD